MRPDERVARNRSRGREGRASLSPSSGPKPVVYAHRFGPLERDGSGQTRLARTSALFIPWTFWHRSDNKAACRTPIGFRPRQSYRFRPFGTRTTVRNHLRRYPRTRPVQNHLPRTVVPKTSVRPYYCRRYRNEIHRWSTGNKLPFFHNSLFVTVFNVSFGTVRSGADESGSRFRIFFLKILNKRRAHKLRSLTWFKTKRVILAFVPVEQCPWF